MSFEIHNCFFDAGRIADSGQCFRWRHIGEGVWRIPAFGRLLEIVQPAEDVLKVYCSPMEWEEIWRRYLDWDTDYEAVAAKVDPADDYLLCASNASRGIRILRQPLWETMLGFLISQNNNIPRIRKSLNTICGSEEAPFPSPGDIARMTEEQLRSCGVGYRAPYIQKAALRYMQDGLSDETVFSSYGEAKTYLQTFAGIGPKVADCICLFALGMKDAFPMDTWMKRIVAVHYDGIFPLYRYPGCAGILQQWMFYYERQKGNQP